MVKKKGKKRKSTVRRRKRTYRRKRRLWPSGIRQFGDTAESRRIHKGGDWLEDIEEFELTATTKGWTPRRR